MSYFSNINVDMPILSFKKFRGGSKYTFFKAVCPHCPLPAKNLSKNIQFSFKGHWLNLYQYTWLQASRVQFQSLDPC